jgi:hypothetical protein
MRQPKTGGSRVKNASRREDVSTDPLMLVALVTDYLESL